VQAVVRSSKFSTIDELLALLKAIGRRIVEANPKGVPSVFLSADFKDETALLVEADKSQENHTDLQNSPRAILSAVSSVSFVKSTVLPPPRTYLHPHPFLPLHTSVPKPPVSTPQRTTTCPTNSNSLPPPPTLSVCHANRLFQTLSPCDIRALSSRGRAVCWR